MRVSTKYYIYKIVNTVNEMIYIGATCNIKSRWMQHRSQSKMRKYPLHRDMAEYGFDKFSMHVIEELDDIRTIFDREQYWIDHFASMYPNGYNIAPAISSKRRAQR